MESQRIVSLGWFEHGNCGDEAFKEALARLFPAYEFVFVNSITKNLSIINNSAALFIGGGNIIDAGFLRGLDKVTVPHYFIGVGVLSNSNLDLVRKASGIIVRDVYSLELISSVYPDVVLAPDITFILSPGEKKPLEKFPGIDGKRPTVGVFLNDCVSANFEASILKFMECEKVKLELSRFLESLPYNVLFIPFSTQPPDDRRISLDVIGKMKKGYRYHCLSQPLRPLEYLKLISSLDFGISMRLHADIFCTIAGVPFIDIVHHDKNKGYLQTISETELGLDFYELSFRNLRERFAFLEANKKEISARLLQKAAQNKSQLERLAQNVHLP